MNRLTLHPNVNRIIASRYQLSSTLLTPIKRNLNPNSTAKTNGASILSIMIALNIQATRRMTTNNKRRQRHIMNIANIASLRTSQRPNLTILPRLRSHITRLIRQNKDIKNRLNITRRRSILNHRKRPMNLSNSNRNIRQNNSRTITTKTRISQYRRTTIGRLSNPIIHTRRSIQTLTLKYLLSRLILRTIRISLLGNSIGTILITPNLHRLTSQSNPFLVNPSNRNATKFNLQTQATIITTTDNRHRTRYRNNN